MTDLIGHFSALELVWSAIAVVAIIIAGVNLSEANRDLRALGPIRNGRRRIARGNRRREINRIVVNAGNLALGIVAGLIPSSAPSLFGLIFSAIFIVNSAILAVSSYFDGLDRKYLLQFRGDETRRQYEDRIAGEERRAGYPAAHDRAAAAQERTATATERIADAEESAAKD